MRTALLLALCIFFTAIVAQTDDLDTDQIFPVDNRHGRLFPRILSQVQIDLLGAIELNLTLGLDLDLGLGLFKRAGSQRALTPTGVRSIYNTPGGSTAGTGKTVAIVVAYGGSTTESDLAAFNQKFSLPACTTANGCFKKVDQNGGTNIPGDDPTTPKSSSWSGETNLDVQWVHSMAPGAKIILVCANSASSADLYPAVKTAAGLADIVSMSWGGSEGTQKQTYLENVFTTGNANGVSFFVSTGDDGNNAGYPASSSNVVAVGGTTTLTNSDGSFASESAWSGSSGGCSAVYSMSSAQSTNSAAVSACGSKRATPDIALDADPNTGVPVYLDGSWYQYGGTSLACPLTSGRTSAVKAAYPSVTKVDASFIYSKAKFRDVTSGSNSQYSAATGYDRTTGLGAWYGENVATATSATKAATTKAATQAAATTASAAATRCSGLLCLL